MELNVKKIKYLLAEKGMNQSDLASRCSIQRQQISEVFTRKTCSLKTLGKIAKALSVPVIEIVLEVD